MPPVIAMLHQVRRGSGALVLFKVVYLLALSAALLRWSGGIEAFEKHIVATDAKFYLFLSEKGYERGNPTCAFYPLYPLLIRWVSAVTGGHDVLTGMALANLFSLLAFILFFRLLKRRYDKSVAAWALVFLLAFPGSLFYQFIYTESLFFLLLMLLCSALDEGNHPLALITAFLLPITRAVGIFCVFPILWQLCIGSCPDCWRNAANWRGWMAKMDRLLGPSRENSVALKSSRWRGTSDNCLALAPLSGWVTYFLLMQKWTGNPFEGIEAQKRFGVESIHNLFDPVRFVALFFTPTEWHEFRGSALDRCVFILVIYCFPIIWKLDKSWCLWTFFLGVVPAVSGGFTSYTRFASVVFPFFVALAVFLNKPRLRWLRWLVLAAFATLHLILVWRFVNHGWAG